jgi:hypothetical protein
LAFDAGGPPEPQRQGGRPERLPHQQDQEERLGDPAESRHPERVGEPGGDLGLVDQEGHVEQA